VFEVVSEAGGFWGVVFGTDPDGDVGLDAGRFLIDGGVNFEAVVKGVNASVEGVVGDLFVGEVGLSEGQRSRGSEEAKAAGEGEKTKECAHRSKISLGAKIGIIWEG
jgi:hypothetical protein